MTINKIAVISTSLILTSLSSSCYSNQAEKTSALSSNELEQTKAKTIETQLGLKSHISHDDLYYHITLSPLDSTINRVLLVQFGQFLLLDCNKHSLKGEIKEVLDKASGGVHYRLRTVHRGPSTMRSCFDKALTRQFLTLPLDRKIQVNANASPSFSIPLDTQIRVRTWDSENEYLYLPTTLQDKGKTPLLQILDTN